jgi:CheY-like chemotaxis protein
MRLGFTHWTFSGVFSNGDFFGKERSHALEEVRKTWPNVLICDLAMSPMDGYELLESVRRLQPSREQLPAIAYTASARNEDRIRSRQVGFQAHLVKPVMANDLVTTIVGLVKPSS